MSLGLHQASPAPNGTPPTASGASKSAPSPHASPAAVSPTPGIEFVSPPAEPEEDLNADHDDEAPLRFRAIDTVIGPALPPGLAPWVLDEELMFTTADEPVMIAEAEREECRRQAMREEMKSIEVNGSWEPATLPAGHRAIGLKWVFKVKRDEHGNVVRHKAGYIQRAAVDFDEVFALVARMESVRALLALAAHQRWEVHHMDVKSTFLNGDLKEQVLVAQPRGFVIDGGSNKVLRLCKALYGLWQAPRARNAKLDAALAQLGFQRSSSEHGMYTQIASFKQEMKSIFSMSDLGLLSYYLGIEVRQGTDGISLCQTAYAKKLLDRCGMADCNASKTPMVERLKLSKHSISPAVNSTEYRRVIGALCYLVHTRPDLAYSVGYLSRFMEEPHQDHNAAVKQVLRYVAGTCGYGVHYKRQEEGQA
ncbi:hypothetical protein U9M48_034631 [Paspalum notatum var. saurae]|uniref:Reverse transcriptase Ty1/copia-type domain-containing protein n=1 Tax=Paspalum notatum var. saurae TaxID=547442 RepID=A0AAQ3X6X3_PASNO